MPKVSVIVPIYNSEKTLDRCLDSIVGQTHRDLEIILVNDGSADGSLQKCREYADRDSRIIVIDKPNGGVSSARNAGIERATGEYTAFVDSDDWLDLTMYEKLAAKAEKDGLDLTVCRFYTVCEGGHRIEKSTYHGLEDGVVNGNIRKILLGSRAEDGGASSYVWCVLFGKRIMRDLRFDEEITVSEDTVFFLNALSMAEKCGVLDEYLYYYVVCDNTDESNWTKYVSQSRYVPSRIKRARFFYDLFEKRGLVDELGFALFDEFALIVHKSCIKDKDYLRTIAAVEKGMPYSVFPIKKCYKIFKKFRGRVNYGLKDRVLNGLVYHRLYRLIRLYVRLSGQLKITV